MKLSIIFLLFLFLENILPLRKQKHSLKQRIIINLCLSGLVFVIGAFILRPIAISLAGKTAHLHFGALFIFPLPGYAQFMLGFLLMDLTFYYWHRANHFFPVLRRFHNVHHVDTDLDVTTSFRFHFVEILYSIIFRVFQIALIGVTPTIYAFYELIFQYATMFHHSNIRLPIYIERLLNKVFVTPRMHGIHHSIVKAEINSNFSVVFCWWDWLHKTLRLNVPQLDIEIGLAGYQEPKDNTLWNLLCLPFRKQRKTDKSSFTRKTKNAKTKRTFMSE
jgi:sterol desaturase/sphingolipid hydroxylase (fatty acid hydroxylase superfamily)